MEVRWMTRFSGQSGRLEDLLLVVLVRWLERGLPRKGKVYLPCLEWGAGDFAPFSWFII